MSVLIAAADLITLTDDTAVLLHGATDFITAIDVSSANAKLIAAALQTIFAASPDEFAQWYPSASGIYQVSGGSVTASGSAAAFGSQSVGNVGGAFGNGQGALNRAAILTGVLKPWLEGIRKNLSRESVSDGIVNSRNIAIINDLVTYATYRNSAEQILRLVGSPAGGTLTLAAGGVSTGNIAYNASSATIQAALVALTAIGTGGVSVSGSGPWTIAAAGPNLLAILPAITANGALLTGGTTPNAQVTPTIAILYSSDFAMAYWYAYNQGQQLDPSVVFAPGGANALHLCRFTTTGTNAGTISNNTANNWPSSNGAASQPTPTTDGYGRPVYLGGLPMPQAFAPTKAATRVGATAINGTCVVTVTAPNQAGVSAKWTATISNQATGVETPLVPNTTGDRMNGVPTAIAIAGAATLGVFDIVTAAER